MATKKKFNKKTFEMPETLPVRLYDLSFSDALVLDEEFGLGIDELFSNEVSNMKRAVACVFLYLAQNYTGVTKADVMELNALESMSRIELLIEDPDPKD